MSFGVFPFEIVFLVCKSLGDDAYLNPFEVTPQKIVSSRALKSLRLTSKRIGQIATRELFRHFHDKSDLNSWGIFLSFLKQTFFVQNLRHLTLENCRYEGQRDLDRVRRRFHDKSARPDLLHDLSVFPHLESIQTEEWLLVNAQKVRIPARQYYLHLSTWSKCSRLFHCPEIARLGLEFQTWTANLERLFLPSVLTYGARDPEYCMRHSPEELPSMDFSKLRFLELNFNKGRNSVYKLDCVKTLFPQLQYLPSLRTFKLAQRKYLRYFTKITLTDAIFASDNLVKILLVLGKNWLNLQHLELGYLTTTLADLREFLIPHAFTLESLEIEGSIDCNPYPSPTPKELEDFAGWVRSEISPRGFTVLNFEDD